MGAFQVVSLNLLVFRDFLLVLFHFLSSIYWGRVPINVGKNPTKKYFGVPELKNWEKGHFDGFYGKIDPQTWGSNISWTIRPKWVFFNKTYIIVLQTWYKGPKLTKLSFKTGRKSKKRVFQGPKIALFAGFDLLLLRLGWLKAHNHFGRWEG